MKRLIIYTLALIMLLPGGALAERLTFDVMPNVKIDADAPDSLPEAMCEMVVEPLKIDLNLAQQLLMPGNPVREDCPGGQVTFGEGDGESEYMLIDVEYGRICYGSKFFHERLGEVLNCDDEMTDALHYYPEDREVEGFPRIDARRQADELIDKLGYGEYTLAPRVLTLDVASYGVMLEDLSQADWQADIPRVYLEPYDSAHDGYLLIYPLAIDGIPILNPVLDRLILFVSRQGIEHVETGYPKCVTQRGDTAPVLTAEDALRVAVPQIEAALKENKEYVIGTTVNDVIRAALIERVRLGYAFALEDGGNIIDWSQVVPVWEYCYLRAMWTDGGTWQTRSFDNPAFLGRVRINATTGEYIDTLQY